MNSTAPIHVRVAARRSTSVNARLKRQRRIIFLEDGKIMKKFEYEITEHPSSEFQQLAYFCSADGECAIEQIPVDQIGKLRNILNEKGAKSWELIQLSFGKSGVIAYWKREAE